MRKALRRDYLVEAGRERGANRAETGVRVHGRSPLGARRRPPSMVGGVGAGNVNNDSIQGGFGDRFGENVGVQAKSGPSGENPQGHESATTPGPGPVQFRLRVTCLAVQGSLAAYGTVVAKSNDPNNPPGTEFVEVVRDGGLPGGGATAGISSVGRRRCAPISSGTRRRRPQSRTGTSPSETRNPDRLQGDVHAASPSNLQIVGPSDPQADGRSPRTRMNPLLKMRSESGGTPAQLEVPPRCGLSAPETRARDSDERGGAPASARTVTSERAIHARFYERPSARAAEGRTAIPVSMGGWGTCGERIVSPARA